VVARVIQYFSWVPDSSGDGKGWGIIVNRPSCSATILESLDSYAIVFGGKYNGLNGWSVKINLFLFRHPDHFVLLDCSLTNASFLARFDFRVGQQRLDLERGNDLVGVGNFNGGDPSPTFKADVSLSNKTISHLPIMDAFSRTMVGSVALSHYSGTTSTSLRP